MPQQAKDINDNVGMEAHIYENLPVLTSTPKGHLNAELRKYFPREAIYENLCRGCGYGVFAAQGRYCHFCQCIVSGGVVSTPPPPPPTPPPLLPISGESSNIYENICDLCRGIYSDNERCRCQRSETPAKAPAPSAPPTAPTPSTPPTKVKSRSLLGYSKSSAATLTRLFGSLKQLNRSSSLQRRIFPRTPTNGSGSAGSLEIIHNVDEVFRTQETFDLQRICELKLEQQQLKSSQSDQHIYGRVREPEESQSHKRERKKPRVSRIRLLQDESAADASGSSSLYLNESICQWMTSLRRQVHHYDEGPWQQPKSVPARDPLTAAEESSVTLRRSTEERAKCADEQAKLVKDFKRKLQLKRVDVVEPVGLEREQRRCAITANFVSGYLSALGEEKESLQQQQVVPIEERVAVAALQPQVSVCLLRLMQSLALSASLHVCVRGFLTIYDKSFGLWLWLQQQQQQQQPPINGYRRRRARDSVVGDWRRRLPLFAFSIAGGNDQSLGSASASASVSVSPAISESVDVYAAAASRRRANRSTKRRGTAIVREEGVRGGESSTSSNNDKKSNNNKSNNNNNNNSGALMAAPKPNGEAERPTTNNNNNISSNNNNNHHTVDNESGINNNNNNNNANCNANEQQQQQQQQPITQKCVIKVRRPAPKVPVRNPNTSLSNPRQSEEEQTQPNGGDKVNLRLNSFAAETPSQEEQEEESIYQPIWQFKTLEPVDQEIIEAFPVGDEDEEDEDEEDDDVDDEEEDLGDYDESLPSDADADVMALQAAAVFAAGVRHKLSTSTLTKRSKMMMPTPLPSPTASMDHGAWETDMEFMYSRESKEEADETLSLGSTVTNSTATLGSISSTGSSVTGQLKDSPKGLPADQQPPAVATTKQAEIVPLVHPILRNICIFYSQKDPKKYSAIFYDYHRSLVHQRFMTRIRRPAPPPPAQVSTPATTSLPPRSDDSGCSCLAEDPDHHRHIPQPLKEEWERAVLAAGAVGGKRGVAPRAGRKLRVRSNARLLLTDSVLAWRESLQDVHCCEDEEDMIVPVTDILRAQQIQEDNEVQQTQQTTILQRFKSVSIGNLLDLPGEDDKKSIKNRMRMKFAVNSNVFRINRSPKSEKKSRPRRGQVNSLYLDEQKYPLFAAPLSALELNMTDHPNVPRFVVDICAYIEKPECIEQDGLYRASGNKVLVDDLRKRLTHLYDPSWLRTDDIHTLTSLHKQFFRELTSPLITQEAYERLGKSLNDDAAIERMSLAFDDMPEPNRSTLRFLIRHLTRVAAASASNRMPSTNLAIVWGPCLLSANQIQLDIGRMNMLAKVLIENYDRIFHPDNERLVC
ncbi:uncharacterized protein LOC6550407 isoform X1 [Drosophila erecta]|uniref:Uncharacterized protein, isoform A n=1 Tax=Drosophila erecta TaxID=7220 RepID=B3NUR8_DROER|nr:uncharacterized protein LOC6550407 isoform X1 [Drosophila erecta]XP_026837265.1 uncharacterized protein LOC6550407 isoform X1 [Drosophila erecta]EDV46665.2 uncharacterized protein Dere_GG18077, isoform A [Drosophila erecta]